MAERIAQLRPLGIYPWAEWTDGHAWRIRRGEDFDVSVASMRSALFSYAYRAGKTVATRIDGDAIEFQFADAEQAA